MKFQSEFQKYHKTMKQNKSARFNFPGVRFVKFNAKIVALYLSKLFNKCIEYGVFPGSLRGTTLTCLIQRNIS